MMMSDDGCWMIQETHDKLAEVHLRLGDLQTQNGKYLEAIDDYHKSKELYQQSHPADARVLAEVSPLSSSSSSSS